MPQIDKPLHELKTYTGMNPRPDDFEQYWEDGLNEMRAVDARVELVPSAFKSSKVAECFDLYFTGVGGSRIHAKYLRPRGASAPCPAAVAFHGYMASAGEWQDKIALVSQGIAVAALDVRGQGGTSEDLTGSRGTTVRGHIVRGLDDPDPKRLAYRSIFLDTAQLAGIVMGFPEIDPGRVGAYGGSQGGALALACGALEPRIRRVASVFPFLCDYKRVWDMDLAEQAYEGLQYFFRSFDPMHGNEDAIFRKLGYIDCQFLAPRIKGEVLMATGLMDKICPPSTQFAAYNKIESPKQMALFPDFGHEHLPGFNDTIFEFLSKL